MEIIDVFILMGTIHLGWLLFQMVGGVFGDLFKKQNNLFLSEYIEENEQVLLLIPVCNEDPGVLRQTLASCKDLLEARVVVVENSSNLDKKSSLEKVCLEEKVECYSIENLGNKARALNHYLENHDIQEPYISVLDVDQVPAAEFLETILPHFNGREELGLVQTPQAFRNEKKSFLTFVYAAMQSIFFRGVCVARGRIGFTVCLGTNFVMRLSALRAIGGFDENSQTEDVATSLKLSLSGYKTKYLDQVLVYGLVPNRFKDVLKQMKRYTIGSNQVMGKILGNLLWQPKYWKKGNGWVFANYLHYVSTLLVGSIIFFMSFFSDHILVFVNLMCIVLFILLMLVWLPFYKMLTGLLFFTIILPFTLIFNLDVTAYNRKFAVTSKKIEDQEEEMLVLAKKDAQDVKIKR